MKSVKTKRKSDTPIQQATGTAIQRLLAEVFASRSKGYRYTGEFLVTQFDGEELEVWYRYLRGEGAFEFVMWFMPEGIALLQARALQKKRYRKLVFKFDQDFSSLATGCLELPQLRKRIEKLAQAYDQTLLELRLHRDEPELPHSVKNFWERAAAR